MLLQKLLSCEKTEIGYLLRGDAADVLLVFLTDDIIRIRVSFSRAFPEASYTLVTTAWEDSLDSLFAGERQRIAPLCVPCEETEKTLVFETASLRLVLRREPFSFSLYTAAGECIYRDLPERAFERDQQAGRHDAEHHAEGYAARAVVFVSEHGVGFFHAHPYRI